MKEFVEKLIGSLEELKCKYKNLCDACDIDSELQYDLGRYYGVFETISIVNQLAKEHNNGWIPCSERLPEYTGEYNATVVVASELGSFEYVTTLCFENIKGKEPRWVIPKDEIYRVIAWMELPKKYQKGE